MSSDEAETVSLNVLSSCLYACSLEFASTIQPRDLLALSQVCTAIRFGPLDFNSSLWTALLQSKGVVMTGDAYSMLSCSYFNVPTLATTTTSSKGETYFQKEEETEYGMMVRRTAKYYALRLCLKHCWSGIAQIQVAENGLFLGVNDKGQVKLNYPKTNLQATLFAITSVLKEASRFHALIHVSSRKHLSINFRSKTLINASPKEKLLCSWDFFEVESGINQDSGFLLVSPRSLDTPLRFCYNTGKLKLCASVQYPEAHFVFHYLLVK